MVVEAQYLRQVVQGITLRNVGKTPATFQVTETSVDWLHFNDVKLRDPQMIEAGQEFPLMVSLVTTKGNMGVNEGTFTLKSSTVPSTNPRYGGRDDEDVQYVISVKMKSKLAKEGWQDLRLTMKGYTISKQDDKTFIFSEKRLMA